MVKLPCIILTEQYRYRILLGEGFYEEKRLLAMLMAAILLVAILPTIASAAGDSTSVGITVDTSTKGEVSVTLSYTAMTVTSFTAGINFDNTALSVKSITTGAGYTAMDANDVVMVLSNEEEANASGKIGFGMACTKDHQYAAADLITVTFRVIKAGQTTLSVYEDTDGTMAFAGDEQDQKTTPALEVTIMLGDVNGDQAVDVADITMIRDHILKTITLTADQIMAADVNTDTVVDVADITRIRDYILKTIPTL